MKQAFAKAARYGDALYRLDRTFGQLYGKIRASVWLLVAIAAGALAYPACVYMYGWPMIGIVGVCGCVALFALWRAWAATRIERVSDAIIDDVQSRMKYAAPAVPVAQAIRDRLFEKSA